MTGPATYVPLSFYKPHLSPLCVTFLVHDHEKIIIKLTASHRPGQEGPTFGPPPLPEGWIAQWDGMGKKYYFVQLATGKSQWDTPTQPAPTGPTPQATPQEGLEHPYGTPGEAASGGEGGAADGERGLGVRYILHTPFTIGDWSIAAFR